MNEEKQFSGIFHNIFNARNIVFVAMLAVGILCIYMSARNTASYLLLTGMEHIMAIMTGIALIVFSATSFTAAQLFLAQKGAAKLFSLMFIVVGITVITFSIFSTLSLNYTKFIDSEAIRADIADKVEKSRSEIMAQYRASEAEAEGQDIAQWTMLNMERFLSLAEQQGSSWNNSMRTVLETAQTLNTVVQGKQQSIDEILENIYIETIPRTFFGFMLSLSDLDRKYFLDFFMIAIPAVFYDLIAPLAVTVVLFLMGFQRKEKPQEKPQQKPEKTKSEERPQRREKQPPQPPDIKEVVIYIESALQDDFSLLPDDAIGNIEEKQCKRFREYLMSFVYKKNPIITEKDGRFVSIFDKTNLKKFIELLDNVQRKGE